MLQRLLGVLPGTRGVVASLDLARVCGVSSVEQLEENLGALELQLSCDDLKACDEVWQRLRPAPTMFYARGYGINFE